MPLELPKFVKDVKMMVITIASAIGAITTIWAFGDIIVTDEELKASEERVIAEVRTETARNRVVVIEDMEARLDDLDFQINMAQTAGEPPNQALIIQRNSLERRIEKLKENETTTGNP